MESNSNIIKDYLSTNLDAYNKISYKITDLESKLNPSFKNTFSNYKFGEAQNRTKSEIDIKSDLVPKTEMGWRTQFFDK